MITTIVAIVRVESGSGGRIGIGLCVFGVEEAKTLDFGGLERERERVVLGLERESEGGRVVVCGEKNLGFRRIRV